MSTTVHLIYIHGFQGDDTTFQSFPRDLHEHLSSHIPPHLKLRTSLYPTYKSVKPISFATKNFLEWLSTQPAGPVILVGHSMGGLLVADAATVTSSKRQDTRHRIIGMLAFDTPYLGMHPHVVITGIASLFAKNEEEEKDKKTEKQMNDHPGVNVVDDKVTDDWEAFKNGQNNSRPSIQSTSPSQSSLAPSSGQRPSLPPRPSSHTQSNQPPSLPPRPSSHLQPTSPSPSLSPSSSRPTSPFLDRTINFISSHSNDPMVRWIRKHADDPFSAGKTWVIERFQFGICMFDPSGLKERYDNLVKWDGPWCNYWTQTLPKPKQNSGIETSENESKDEAEEDKLDNDIALLETGITDISIEDKPSKLSSESPSLVSPDLSAVASPGSDANEKDVEKANKAREKEQRKAEKEKAKVAKQAEKEREKAIKRLERERKAKEKELAKQEKGGGSSVPRHFVVLPNGLGSALGGGEKWEKVVIAGCEDEVAAHCGMFIREQNHDYDGLVERVSRKVMEWCKVL